MFIFIAAELLINAILYCVVLYMSKHPSGNRTCGHVKMSGLPSNLGHILHVVTVFNSLVIVPISHIQLVQ